MTLDDQDLPVEDRLRSALASVAATQEGTDDWPGVLARGDRSLTELDVAVPPTARRRAVLLAAAVVLVLAAIAAGVSALGDRGSGQRVQTVDLADAADAAQASTARASITQELPGSDPTHIDGELDFVHHRSHLRGMLGAPTSVGGGTAGLDQVPADVRKAFEVIAAADEVIAIGDRSYVHSKGRWWDLGTTEQSAGEPDLLSPTEVLDQIRHLGKVRTIGDERVRGVPATHYRTTDHDTGYRYDVWVDAAGRAVRVTTSLDDPEGAGPMRVSVELFDFGAPVSITAPADAELLALAPTVDGPIGGAADVDLHQVASGREGAVSWRLSTGELADGRRCVQVDTDPAIDGEAVQLGVDGNASMSVDVPAGSHGGPSCGPGVVNPPDGSGAVLLTVGGRKGKVHYLAGLLRAGAKVTVTFHDGHTEVLEGHDGAFILTFSGGDWPTRMEGGNTSCELQGDRTTSGADQVC